MVKLILLYNECTDLGLLKPTLGGFGVLQVFRFWSFDTFCPYGLPYAVAFDLSFFIFLFLVSTNYGKPYRQKVSKLQNLKT